MPQETDLEESERLLQMETQEMVSNPSNLDRLLELLRVPDRTAALNAARTTFQVCVANACCVLANMHPPVPAAGLGWVRLSWVVTGGCSLSSAYH